MRTQRRQDPGQQRKQRMDSLLLALALFGGLLTQVGVAAGTFRITEFMADNGSTLRDEDGDYSDWIEIYNSSSALQSLDGWCLTDDARTPSKWRFPPGIELPPASFLLVFASGKDRTNTTLHTN